LIWLVWIWTKRKKKWNFLGSLRYQLKEKPLIAAKNQLKIQEIKMFNFIGIRSAIKKNSKTISITIYTRRNKSLQWALSMRLWIWSKRKEVNSKIKNAVIFINNSTWRKYQNFSFDYQSLCLDVSWSTFSLYHLINSEMMCGVRDVAWIMRNIRRTLRRSIERLKVTYWGILLFLNVHKNIITNVMFAAFSRNAVQSVARISTRWTARNSLMNKDKENMRRDRGKRGCSQKQGRMSSKTWGSCHKCSERISCKFLVL